MQPKDQIFARMYVVLTLLSVVPVLVAFQVFRVSFVDGAQLKERGQEQATSYVDIPAMRGAIYDAAGRALAVNVERWDVTLDPQTNGFQAESAAFYERLSRITGESKATLSRRVQRRTSPRYVLVGRGLTMDHADVDALNDIPGVYVLQRFSRKYNYNQIASHIVGHVDSDARGIEGLELQYDEFLKGVPGQQAARVDRVRNKRLVPGGLRTEPEHGDNLVLTIDLVRQTILEEELAKGVEAAGAKWGSAIAINPKTGAILAMANVPTYDPNRYGSFGAAGKRNHAITDQIEPGSTFKIVPAVAALETGAVEMTDSVETGNGVLYQHGYTLRDTHANGTITFADVIRLSSNIGTAMVAEKMDRGRLYQYARQFGFGQRTWIDLPGETEGVVKGTENWSRSTLSAMSRGYEISATPLQMLLAYASLANDGQLVKPYVVQQRTDVTGRVVWEAESEVVRRAYESKTVRELMPAFEAVVDSGTATAAQIKGLRVAGKTGTAWKAGPSGYIQGAYRATFVGLFPVDDPSVALIVVMDEPRTSMYGGIVAAPVFHETARRWLTTMPEVARLIKPEGAADALADSLVAEPEVDGFPEAIARRRLLAHGLRGSAPPGQDSLEVMPDLRGLAARDALAWLSGRGIRVRMKGHGLVSAQWPGPGQPLAAAADLTLK